MEVPNTIYMVGEISLFRRCVDLFISPLAIIVSLPLYLSVIVWYLIHGETSFVYRQQRVGSCGKIFTMYKFRTMCKDAEPQFPLLSSSSDSRVMSWCRHLRRYHLDELPQLFNVLFGDMTFIGPRPERAFFIDQILVKYPDFRLILQLKPGISSYGMVKFGYADSVDKMIQRAAYDIEYAQNRSFLFDLKVLYLTFSYIFKNS